MATMLGPSSGSLRLPSSPAGIPNICGSGAGCAANSAVKGPRCDVTMMKWAMPAPQPLFWYVS